MIITQTVLERLHQLGLEHRAEFRLREALTDQLEIGCKVGGNAFTGRVHYEKRVLIWNHKVAGRLGPDVLDALMDVFPIMKVPCLQWRPTAPKCGGSASCSRVVTIQGARIERFLGLVEQAKEYERMKSYIIGLLAAGTERERGRFSAWTTPRRCTALALADVIAVLGTPAANRLCGSSQRYRARRLVISDRATGAPLGWDSPEWLEWCRSPESLGRAPDATRDHSSDVRSVAG